MPDAPALPGWPRGLSEPLAAAYVGLGVSTFRREVDAGRAPKPARLTPGRMVWLRDDLDAYLDRCAGRVSASAPAAKKGWGTAGGTREPALR